MFKTGMPVKGGDFIDRKKHIPLFKLHLENNQHIMIKAPRRYGKTSLMTQIFWENNYKSVYVDIKRAKDLKHLGDLLIDETYKLFGVDNFLKKTKISLMALLKEIKAKLTINIQNIAEFTLERLEQKDNIDDIEYFLLALEIVEKLAIKEDINIKVAFDEFQDIILFENDILNKVRSVIQYHQNVTYIFLGSIESIMTKIFTSKSSPFFHFTKIIDLGGLDVEELYDYVKEYFQKNNINFSDDIRQVFVYLDGHPYYCMKFMQILYYDILLNKKIDVSKNDYLIALKEAFFDTKSYLEEVLSKVKIKKYHYEILYNLANDIKHNISADMIYKTYKSLEDMGIVKNIHRGEYKINDKFLVLILQQNNELVCIEDIEIDFCIKSNS